MKKFSLLALLALTACYATAQPMYLPDGSQGYRLTCDASYVSNTVDCLQKAGEICGPNGYISYDQNGHVKSEESENQAVIATINNSSNSGSRNARTSAPEAPKSMFIKCRSNEMPLHLAPASNPAPVESGTNPTLQTPTLQDTKPIPLQNRGK